MSNSIILGPAGTGKTRRLMDIFREEVASGTPANAITVVTFTRAATHEFQDRLAAEGIGRDDAPWVRTLHSAAYCLLGLDRSRVMNSKRWKEFCQEFSYELTSGKDPDADDAPFEPPKKTEDDVLRAALSWGRCRMMGVEETIREIDEPRLDQEVFRRFCDRLDVFKSRGGLLEFSDFLSQVLEHNLWPPSEVLIMDEAQDFAPIQIAVAEMWQKTHRRAWLAGDPDQAVYGFQGATSKWLVDCSERYPTEVLRQSYRVPRLAHGLAMRVIRQNMVRAKDVEYRPTPEEGKVWSADMTDAMGSVADIPLEDTFILARNRMFFVEASKILRDQRVPFEVEGSGASSPYSKPTLIRAARAVVALRKGKEISSGLLFDVLDRIPYVKDGILPWGIKEKIENLQRQAIGSGRMVEEFGLKRLVESVDKDGIMILSKEKRDDLEYLDDIAKRFGKIPDPKVRIMTIHGSKGREANRVFVLSDMTNASHKSLFGSQEEYEGENRLAYVATTRTKKDLCIVRPMTRKFYNYPI